MAPSPKQVMRETLLAARRRLVAEDRTNRSNLIAERVVTLPGFARARTVALYAPIGAEVETDAIARAAARLEKRVVYPRIEDRVLPLVFADAPVESFVPGGYRSREPPAAAPVVPPSEIDLVVVPGVAFDPRCRRLGRGRGHYDATLALLGPTAVRVGIAFDLQVVPEVPDEPHDVPLDVVVTETRVLFRDDPAPVASH